MKRIFFLLSVIAFSSINIFSQAIPKQISYQGVLKDASGNILTGDFTMIFKIYDDPSGGSALWTEIQTVAVANGLFNVQLGSTNPIATVPFDRLHFLGITIGTESELSPRILLSPSPYSFMAMNVLDDVITNNKIQDGAVTEAKIASNEVVKSLNGLKDNVNLIEGSNITLTPSGNDITISSTATGVGTITGLTAGSGLTGGGTSGNVILSVADNGITAVMLQDNSITSVKITDGTIVNNDIANGTITDQKLNFTPGTGTVTNIATGSGLTGGPVTTTGTISIATGGVTSAMIQDATITGTDIANGTITGTDIANNTIGAEKLNFTASGIGGSGTTNYLSKFTAATTLGNSIVYQNVSDNIGISTTNPLSKLSVGGDGKTNAAIYGQTNVRDGYGIYGFAKNNNYLSMHCGGYFEADAVEFGTGVKGKTNSYGGEGVYGAGIGCGGHFSAGGTSQNLTYYGVYASAYSSGAGIGYGGYFKANGYGAYCEAPLTGWAGWFEGNAKVTNNLYVTGNIYKASSTFKIDHPLDPTNKNLYHFAVESPNMMNIYNGNAITNNNGDATIELPEWFQALNKDFRYQLTVVGEFAQAIISQKINNNQFSIKTDKPNIEVSWQVTGIRQDAFANTNRIPVEELKRPEERGKYLYPQAFGMPETMGVDYDERHEQERIRMEQRQVEHNKIKLEEEQ